MLKENIDLNKYEKHEKIMSIAQIYLYAFLLMTLPCALCFLGYIAVWGVDWAFADYNDTLNYFLLYLIYSVFFVLGNQLTRAVVIALFCEGKFKSAELHFNWKSLMINCRCKEILSVRQLRTLLIAPIVVTGIIPFAVSLVVGYSPLMLAGITMILGEGASLALLIMTMKLKKNDLAEEPPPPQYGMIIYKLIIDN